MDKLPRSALARSFDVHALRHQRGPPAPTRSACTGAICTGTWRPLAQAQAQGRVPSTRLLVHGLARADQDGLHCYLTTQPDVSASIHRPE
jgi:hypothetical protein